MASQPAVSGSTPPISFPTYASGEERRTLHLFLKRLDTDRFSRVPAAIQAWHSQEPEGWLGLGPSEQKAKLEELARFLHELIVIFENDGLDEPYQLLVRLFSEQCEYSRGTLRNPDEEEDGRGYPPIPL